MKNKKLILAAVALVAVIAVMAGLFLSSRTAGTEDRKTITVTVVHKDGSQKEFVYQTTEQLLGQVLYGEGLIQAENVDEGMFNIVDGEKADWNVDQSYWSLYEGDEYAVEGVDTLVIEDGDTFKLVYTIGF